MMASMISSLKENGMGHLPKDAKWDGP